MYLFIGCIASLFPGFSPPTVLRPFFISVESKPWMRSNPQEDEKNQFIMNHDVNRV